MRDRSWLLCRGWPNCFACAIDRGFVDADGRTALRARSIVGLLPRMAEVWLRDPRRLRADPRFAQQKAALHARSIVGLLPQMAEVWLRDPRRLRSDPRFAQQNRGSEVCMRDPRIIAQKLGSEVCAAKSSWSESVLCA